MRTVEFHALVFIPAVPVGVDWISASRRASRAGEVGSSGAVRTSSRKAELLACRYAGVPAAVARKASWGVVVPALPVVGEIEVDDPVGAGPTVEPVGSPDADRVTTAPDDPDAPAEGSVDGLASPGIARF